MLTSSVFLQTSIPNIPSITVLSLHHSPKGRKRLTVLLAAQQICLFAKQSATYKGRAFHRTPPAQIRTCGFPAYGSCLGWVTAQVAVYAPAPLTRDPGSESSTCFADAYSPWPPPFAPPTPLRPPPQTPPQ